MSAECNVQQHTDIAPNDAAIEQKAEIAEVDAASPSNQTTEHEGTQHISCTEDFGASSSVATDIENTADADQKAEDTAVKDEAKNPTATNEEPETYVITDDKAAETTGASNEAENAATAEGEAEKSIQSALSSPMVMPNVIDEPVIDEQNVDPISPTQAENGDWTMIPETLLNGNSSPTDVAGDETTLAEATNQDVDSMNAAATAASGASCAETETVDTEAASPTEGLSSEITSTMIEVGSVDVSAVVEMPFINVSVDADAATPQPQAKESINNDVSTTAKTDEAAANRSDQGNENGNYSPKVALSPSIVRYRSTVGSNGENTEQVITVYDFDAEQKIVDTANSNSSSKENLQNGMNDIATKNEENAETTEFIIADSNNEVEIENLEDHVIEHDDSGSDMMSGNDIASSVDEEENELEQSHQDYQSTRSMHSLAEAALQVKNWMKESGFGVPDNIFDKHIGKVDSIVAAFEVIITKFEDLQSTQSEGISVEDESYSRLRSNVKLLENGNECLTQEINKMKTKFNIMKYRYQEQLQKVQQGRQNVSKAKGESKQLVGALTQRLSQAYADLNKERKQNSMLVDKLKSLLSSKDPTLKDSKPHAGKRVPVHTNTPNGRSAGTGHTKGQASGAQTHLDVSALNAIKDSYPTSWQQHCQEAFDNREKYLLDVIRQLKMQLNSVA